MERETVRVVEVVDDFMRRMRRRARGSKLDAYTLALDTLAALDSYNDTGLTARELVRHWTLDHERDWRTFTR